MKQLTIFLFAFIFIVRTTSGHVGGHYHSGDGTVFNSWTLKNGQHVLGNFMYSNGRQIFVEANEGKIIAIQMDDLMPADKKLAAFKISQLEKINRPYEPLVSSNIFDLKKIIWWVIGFTIVLAFLSLLVNYFRIEYVKQNRYQFLVAYASVILIVACSKSGTSGGTVTQPTIITIPKTTTTFLDSAFAAFKPALSTRYDATYFYIASSGIPNHNMMIGITNW